MTRRLLELVLLVVLIGGGAWFMAQDRPRKEEWPMRPLAGASPPELREVVVVDLTTSHGLASLELYPQAAPRHVARFLELVDSGFYNDTAIVRVVPDFVVQFGINADPKYRHWKDETIEAEPNFFEPLTGTIAMAEDGQGRASTQLYINMADNFHLRERGGAVFGRVIEQGLVLGDNMTAMEVLRSLPALALDQDLLWAGKTPPGNPGHLFAASRTRP
ncbi:MAG: peptidylprolyl isomerase [Candidatus Eremiobacteraeota bacterium]|nr:peptidylprolyl isomerase [Candidatus Eremiobacteraeota bacterium]